jgi:DNA invertase Pin-like site-specific DNA recombinase
MAGRKIGYARSATGMLDEQIVALEAAGCEVIHCEHVGGGVILPPILQNAIAAMEAGDELVIVSLDRLGRSLEASMTALDALRIRSANVTVLDDASPARLGGR